MAPDLFDDATIPPPTLQVEIGQLDEVTHQFAPYAEGGFAPVVHGAQDDEVMLGLQSLPDMVTSWVLLNRRGEDRARIEAAIAVI